MSEEASFRSLAAETKIKYKSKKLSFKRKHDVFLNLIKAEVWKDMVKEAYKALGQAYELLDKCYNDYMDLVNKTTYAVESVCLEEFVLCF